MKLPERDRIHKMEDLVPETPYVLLSQVRPESGYYVYRFLRISNVRGTAVFANGIQMGDYMFNQFAVYTLTPEFKTWALLMGVPPKYPMKGAL